LVKDFRKEENPTKQAIDEIMALPKGDALRSNVFHAKVFARKNFSVK